MAYTTFETTYMLTLLNCVLNDKTAPNRGNMLNWETLFHMASFHDVTAMIYYGILPQLDHVPDEWKGKFRKEFQSDVTLNREQDNEIGELVKALAEAGIPAVLSPLWDVKGFYPQRDMRRIEEISIYFPQGKERELFHLLRLREYDYQGADYYGGFHFGGRSPLVKLCFKKDIFSENRGLRKFYTTFWEKSVVRDERDNTWALTLDEFYLFLLSRLADRYARGEADIRDVMDFYLVVKKYMDSFNWSFITTELAARNLGRFAQCMWQLGLMWFDRKEKVEEMLPDCMEAEEYLLSKGAYGKERSREILPMLTDLEIQRIKDERSERVNRCVRWFFPELHYMEEIYPILETKPWLLFPSWFLRFLSLAFYWVRARWLRIYHKFFFPLDRVIQKVISAVEAAHERYVTGKKNHVSEEELAAGTGASPGTGEVRDSGKAPGTGEAPGTGKAPGTGEAPGTGKALETREAPGTGEAPGTRESPDQGKVSGMSGASGAEEAPDAEKTSGSGEREGPREEMGRSEKDHTQEEEENSSGDGREEGTGGGHPADERAG